MKRKQTAYVNKLSYCPECKSYFVTKECPYCKKSLNDISISERLRTPSDLDLPVFVVAPPIIQSIYVENNSYMEDIEKQFGKPINELFNPDELMRQWFDIYTTISQEALLLTLPPNPLLQDEVWVNSFVYLPHLDEPTCVISNFKAEGRDPEADLVEWYLKEMGYKTYRIPNPEWTFEGEPTLKHIRENIYIGSYGDRTTREALEWIEKKFDCKIIYLGNEQFEYPSGANAYHGDCIFCPISVDKVMVVKDACFKDGLKELEKYVEIIPIEDNNLGEFCITNNVVVGYTIYAGTYIELYNPDDEEFKIELKKIDTLENIAANNGFDIVVFDISQFMWFGAALSCCFARLNYFDRTHNELWVQYGN